QSMLRGRKLKSNLHFDAGEAVPVFSGKLSLFLHGILYLRLELGKGPRFREGEPFLLALRRGYAGDLQDPGIGKIAVVEGLERPGKLPQSLRHAQGFIGGGPLVVKVLRGILENARIAKQQVELRFRE